MLGGIARRRKSKWQSLFLITLALGMVGLMVSCSGGYTAPPPTVTNPGTPKGTSTVTVATTSGSITHTSNLTLTVQ